MSASVVLHLFSFHLPLHLLKITVFMQIIFILIAVSISLALFFLFSFIWANKGGQFDDTYGPAYRMLFDEDNAKSKKEK